MSDLAAQGVADWGTVLVFVVGVATAARVLGAIVRAG